RFGHHATARIETRTECHQIHAVEQVVRERAGAQLGLRGERMQTDRARRLGTGIGHAQAGALARAPARHRQTRFAESEYQYEFARQRAHPVFTSTSAWTGRTAPA